VNVDVRVIAATNRDLEKMMLHGDFREDLYYRLKVIEVFVPPLRERRDEIPFLTDFFLAKYSAKWKKPIPILSDPLRAMILDYHWPGNIRELENVIKQVVVLQDERMIIKEIERQQQRMAAVADARAGAGAAASYTPPPAPPAPPAPRAAAAPDAADTPDADEGADEGDDVPAPADEAVSLVEVSRAAALKAERALIEQTLAQVQWNRRKAAAALGVSYKTLLNKIKECGISR
jgi:DNA-binding NtrC family response regulator